VSLSLGAPRPLNATHLLDEFACGESSLDDWLKRRALANQTSGASRTFVVVDPSGRVFGYYAMAAGSVSHQAAASQVRRNMPDPVPVMVLARLAVDRRAQGIQLGGALLQDAVQRTLAIAQNAGVRALLVHALHERARQFYEHYGFRESPQHPLTLMLRLPPAAA
jgi:GNAT superfamily N-acetyltransferase